MKIFWRVFAGYEFFSRKTIKNIKSMIRISLLSIEYIKALVTFLSIAKINKMLEL